jgi:uncharacterized protein (TIRG00374 family)
MKALLLKLCLAIMIVALLVATVDVGKAVSLVGAVGPLTVIIGLAIGLAQVGILAARWVYVSSMCNIRLPRSEAMRCMLAVQLFSQGPAPSVAGDGLRFWWLTRLNVRPALAAESVMLDRIAGLVSLVALNFIAFAALLMFAADSANLTTLAVIVAIVAALLAVGAARATRMLMARMFRSLPIRFRMSRRARSLFRWLFRFHAGTTELIYSRRGLIVMAAGAFVHFAAVVACWVFARDAKLAVTFTQLLAIVPPVLLLSYLPISVGGWGLREGAMAFGLSLVGLPTSDGVYLGLVLGGIALGSALIGAAVWIVSPMPVSLFGKRRPAQPVSIPNP